MTEIITCMPPQPHLNVGSSFFVLFCVCFAEEDSQADASSINVVLMGTLAKDFNQAVNQGVGSLCHQRYYSDRNIYEGQAVIVVFSVLMSGKCKKGNRNAVYQNII